MPAVRYMPRGRVGIVTGLEPRNVALRNPGVAFSTRILLVTIQSLQNELVGVVGLTSRGQGPYFPKLDSSFCWDGPESDFFPTNGKVVSELRMMSGWLETNGGMGSGIREDLTHTLRTTILPLSSLQQDRQHRRNIGAKHGIYKSTAVKRCQRKGDRPRGGFRLPWARCQADAWDGPARR